LALKEPGLPWSHWITGTSAGNQERYLMVKTMANRKQIFA
jgi:hypothetical protein